MAEKGDAGAGDIFWSENTNTLSFALVLEPEVIRARCGEILYVAMVAFGDAAGALCPPEVSVTYQWPSEILMNGASIGYADLVVSKEATDDVPQWMVIIIDIAITPEKFINDPGEQAYRTTMWDEGCGDISRTELLESVSRHLVNWLHTWSEDGFRPIHDQWIGRMSKDQKMLSGISEQEMLGMDESGNALLKGGELSTSILTFDALDIAKQIRMEASS